MKSSKSTNSASGIFPLNYLFLLFLIPLLISCNWNSSEQKDSERAELDREEKLADEDSGYVVDVTAVDYAFGMPSEIPSGWVTFRMENMGQEEHNAVIFKYVDSLSYEDLAKEISQAVQGDDLESFDTVNSQIETAMGGPAILSPDHTGETTVYLEPGVYTFTCWMVAEDGQYHIQKGMTRPFRVTNEKTSAEKPRTTADITVSDLAINIEDSLGAGNHRFNVNFETKQNVHLARLDEDQKLEDLQSWMTKVQTPSPFTFLGGAEEAPVGMSSTFKATLEPGRYALVTYYYAALGMAEEFTIPNSGKAAPVSNRPVNREIRMESNIEETVLPKQIPAGRTLITVKNTGLDEHRYSLAVLKEGYSVEDFTQYLEEVYIYGKIGPEEKPEPSYQVWAKNISPGEEDTFNLDVEQKKYILTGPVLLNAPPASQWRGDAMYHVMEGIGNVNPE